MTTPRYHNLSPKDKQIVESLLEEVEKHKPWEWDGGVWKTESSYWGFLRGSLRSIWSKKWVFKNNYLNSHKIQIPSIDTKTGEQIVFKTGKKSGQPKFQQGFKDEVTGEIHKIKEAEIDHISPAGSLRSGLEACIFLFRLLTHPNNMRIISKDTHKIITHMERTGMSWEDALLDKHLIAKSKLKVVTQKKELIKAGFTEEEISNGIKRKECYRKLLSKEN